MVTKCVLVTMETRSDNPDFSCSTDTRWVAIKLHVKSEGMFNTLVTMTTDRQQFHKKCPILKVYQLPWLPVNKDSFHFVIF